MSGIVEVTPRPFEVALARVPAGMRLRWPLRAGFADTIPPVPITTWVEAPGDALGFWGADLSIYYSARRIGLYRRAGRPVWQQAARMLDGDPLTPAIVYVLLRETSPYGRPAWLADSIREETTR